MCFTGGVIFFIVRSYINAETEKYQFNCSLQSCFSTLHLNLNPNPLVKNVGPEKMCKRSRKTPNFMNLFFRQFPNFQSNIINIPLFALLWGWIHVYLYLGPSDIHHVHVMHLDLNNLRHFQDVRKQLVKVVWRALNFVLRSWLAMMAEFARGKGWDLNFLWCLSCILSCLTLTGCTICSMSTEERLC